MTVTDDARVRSSLNSVLSAAGMASTFDDDEVQIVLTALDDQPAAAAKQRALQTSASLLFRLHQDLPITAVLPHRLAAQRAIASSGLLFALVQHDAQLVFAHHENEPGQQSMFADIPFDHLLSERSWRNDFSAYDTDLRNLLLHSTETGPDPVLQKAFSGSHLGIVDTNFVAFVNPHGLPQAEAIVAIGELASPWLHRTARKDLADGETAVTAVLDVLTEAFENVMQHAFDGAQVPRSLITIGRTPSHHHEVLRIQILDNGVGLPHSIARRLGEPPPTMQRARELVDLAVNADGSTPPLPGARGRGLPRMRDLTAALGGHLDITTAGPNSTQITVECAKDKPATALSDKVPVTGTIVTAYFPMTSTADE